MSHASFAAAVMIGRDPDNCHSWQSVAAQGICRPRYKEDEVKGLDDRIF